MRFSFYHEIMLVNVNTTQYDGVGNLDLSCDIVTFFIVRNSVVLFEEIMFIWTPNFKMG